MTSLQEEIEAILTDEDVEFDYLIESKAGSKGATKEFRLNRLRTVEAIKDLIFKAELQGGIKELEKLPEKIKETEVSGVAVPRQETDKISLQDLRLVIEKRLSALKRLGGEK